MDHSLFLWEYSRAKITTLPESALSCQSQIGCWKNIKNEYYNLDAIIDRKMLAPSYGSENICQLRLAHEAAERLLVSVQYIIDCLCQVTSFPPMGQQLENLKMAYGAWELADRIAVDILLGSYTISIHSSPAQAPGIDDNYHLLSLPSISPLQELEFKPASVPAPETCNPRDLLLGPDPDFDIPTISWTGDLPDFSPYFDTQMQIHGYDFADDTMEMEFRSMQLLMAPSAPSDILTPEQTPDREMECPVSAVEGVAGAIFATPESLVTEKDTPKIPRSVPSEVPTPEQTPDPEIESPTASVEGMIGMDLSCPHEGCRKVFPRENALLRHISSIHDEKASVSCPHCLESGNWNGKRFNRSDNFQRHVKGRHSNISADDPLIKQALQKLWKAKGVRTSWGKKPGAKKIVSKRKY
ncbi:hypothetical protein DFP73DRAFT_549406 [Morchella snyderi]|nr:hypothetical protein DFP73DRAFT_549406 [Morchella snyderi]